MPTDYFDEFIDNALKEDMGDGDHTSLACIPVNAVGKAHLIVKEPGIISGIIVATRIFRKLDPESKVETYFADGKEVKPGDIAFVVEGRVRALLAAERIVLNIMQRMSGIATATNKYVKALEGMKTKFSTPEKPRRE
jgi:nicotinate-nucleotide pyrophosphorylase (carboxylating)